ncbi:type II and III secretion system protein [Acidobacteria bacterium AB60]|nr:type II and III secretion system protein [Acidobacteria bacterium AB60]
MNKSGFPAFSRAAFWVALMVTTWVWSGAAVHAQSANSLFKQGRAAEQREDFDAAYQDYQKAYAKDPKDIRYRTAMYRVRPTAAAQHLGKGRQLQQSGDEQGALTEYLRAAEIDPGNEAVTQQIAALRAKMGQVNPNQPELSPEEAEEQQQLKSMGSPVELKPVGNEPLTLHMTEDSKNVYQAIGRAAGINVLFDPDYTSKRIQVDLTNSTLMDALRIVSVLSNTFWRPITPNTIFVAQNSRSKRTDLDEQAIQTFYLSNAWQQNDLNDVTTAIRNVLTNIKVYGVASQNALVVRGTPDELLLAQKLINDLDKARPEVVVDIAVMEVSKNWERNLGLAWPSSASVQLQSPNSSSSNGSGSNNGNGSGNNNNNSTNLSIYNLAHLNSTDFAVSVGAATANLLLSDSNTRILQNPRLRATDAQKATMKIGERIPIATGSYQTGAATALVSSLVNTQFQYLDVGVNIEVTPTVHFDRDVTLKMKIEVTAQAGSSTISGVTEPIIAQKSTEEVVRLREGEANILSGILNQQDQVSWSGIPGLSSIPILKYLFGSKDHTITNDEVVFLMVPHIVRGTDLTPENLRPVDTGVGQAVELRRIAVNGPGLNSPAQVQPVTTHAVAPTAANLATVPGQSAATAAPQAMAQLNASANSPAETVPQPNLGANPPATVPAGTPPTTPPAPPTTAPPATSPNAAPAAAGNAVRLMLNPPGPVKNGATFQVPVVIAGGADVSAVPLQIQYDAAKLSLVNVGPGDFLSRDGQSVAETHRDDGPGNINLNISRPRGSAGVSGAGVVCVLSFQAKASGDTNLSITRAGATTSSGQALPVQGSQISVNIQ